MFKREHLKMKFRQNSKQKQNKFESKKRVYKKFTSRFQYFSSDITKRLYIVEIFSSCFKLTKFINFRSSSDLLQITKHV